MGVVLSCYVVLGSRVVSYLRSPAALGFPPYGRRPTHPWQRWGCVSLGEVSGAAKSQHILGVTLSCYVVLGSRVVLCCVARSDIEVSYIEVS